ncbi:hypothetical protein IWX87_002811 [Polaromonas sp. CG_9.7]|uniref:hypothetical protein n=1 Tax=unclassified Polaromonas TaxID=2638319 RepID=UPI0018CA0971|nr:MULTISPECIES: hypothetical protein [unclassified Polaromonas]MBG6073040.1 hypothetical protein [Polaromonas sp. CG_9.7]MBG6115045.1 hypothetical protein [Polaromonas sp. CG_9.2]MDH6186032.1 hypothetical protein [Polaromonas sp. CG_23.6]
MKTCLRFYEIKKLILGNPCDGLITTSDRIVQRSHAAQKRKRPAEGMNRLRAFTWRNRHKAGAPTD